MARYYLHLRDGSDELLDQAGSEFENVEALRQAVVMNARDCLCGDLRNGIIDLRYRIDAEDENGAIAYSMPFKHAFSIIPEES